MYEISLTQFMHLWEMSLQWRQNGHDSVSNHQPHGCLLNRLFRRRSKKTSKLRVTGLCAGNSPGTSEFPAQMASKVNAENISIDDVIMVAVIITHLPLVTHICVGGSRQHWSRYWLVAWAIGNKLQWNLNHNQYIFIQENAFENVVCEMVAILSRGRWVKVWLSNSSSTVAARDFVVKPLPVEKHTT